MLFSKSKSHSGLIDRTPKFFKATRDYSMMRKNNPSLNTLNIWTHRCFRVKSSKTLTLTTPLSGSQVLDYQHYDYPRALLALHPENLSFLDESHMDGSYETGSKILHFLVKSKPTSKNSPRVVNLHINKYLTTGEGAKGSQGFSVFSL